jgi:hypothetical protein
MGTVLYRDISPKKVEAKTSMQFSPIFGTIGLAQRDFLSLPNFLF